MEIWGSLQAEWLILVQNGSKQAVRVSYSVIIQILEYGTEKENRRILVSDKEDSEKSKNTCR